MTNFFNYHANEFNILPDVFKTPFRQPGLMDCSNIRCSPHARRKQIQQEKLWNNQSLWVQALGI